ncbi:hypothetical protein M422DRAFT_785355 [Sphaerobolus stellatus SS14]|uniref:Uncharacterized protein n=1 Tax=Sphaerobolus stellatus (strain SS14) TaxID=990650 RepID=A0A0C9ULB9_SPHS4|nr:hypothetical protein M422DRAFT_785355 [Sphaerobolus stellatus SS14]
MPCDLKRLTLANHTLDVRPTMAKFTKILMQSPSLEYLRIKSSEPADWSSPSVPISLDDHNELVISTVAISHTIKLFERISFPNLVSSSPSASPTKDDSITTRFVDVISLFQNVSVGIARILGMLTRHSKRFS